jgi:hypothetical protein
MQLGSIVYSSLGQSGGINVPPFANNGLSITAGVVQLGGLLGSAAPAVLLNNREIPMAGFALRFSGIAAGNINPGIVLQASATKFATPFPAAPTPFIFVLDSAGAELGKIDFLGLNLNIGKSTGWSATSATGTERNTSIGQGANFGSTTGTRITVVGANALNQNSTGSFHTAVGTEALFNQLSGDSNTAIGYQSMFQTQTGQRNTSVGVFSGAGAYLNSTDSVYVGYFAGARTTIAAAALNQVVIIGAQSFGLNAPGGSNMVAIGFNIYPAAELGGTNCIFIGANITNGGAVAITNSTAIGQGLDIRISNIVGLGRTDQNVIIGLAAAAVDSGNRLQVNGKLNTGGAAPLTLGAGAMDFGKVVTAASALNATKYLEMSVDGVLVKVCIN